MFRILALVAVAMLFTDSAFSQTTKTHVYDTGEFGLTPGQVFDYIWNAPSQMSLACTWVVTPSPYIKAPDVYMPEQRVEVTRLFFVRKGPGSDVPGQLVLSFTFRNIGTNPASGHIIISAICLE